MAYLAAADYHYVLYGVHLVFYLAEEFPRLAGSRHYRNDVLFFKHEFAVCNVDFIAALNRAYQHIAVQLGYYLLDGAACKRAVFRQAEFQKLHSASAEYVDFYCGREPQHPCYLACRCEFRVYHHSKAQLVFQKLALAVVFGVPYSGYGVAVARLLRDEAAQQVQLV